MRFSQVLICLKVKVAQLCPTLCDPMDHAVHGILQARILEPFPSPGDLPNPGIPQVLNQRSCQGRFVFATPLAGSVSTPSCPEGPVSGLVVHASLCRWPRLAALVCFKGVLVCSNICCCSVTKLCLTLCNPVDCSSPGFPVLHYLLEFA